MQNTLTDGPRDLHFNMSPVSHSLKGRMAGVDFVIQITCTLDASLTCVLSKLVEPGDHERLVTPAGRRHPLLCCLLSDLFC